MNKGFVQIKRRVLDSWIYKKPSTRNVFLHLLLSANWDYGCSKGVTVEPGQVVTSQRTIAKELQMGRQEVRTALKQLEDGGAISIDKSTLGMLITIGNSWIIGIGDSETNPRSTRVSTHILTNKATQVATAEDIDMIDVEENQKDKSTHVSTHISTHVSTPNKENTDIYDTQIKKLMEFFNEHCISFPKVREIKKNTKRYKAIRARLTEYSYDDMITVFQNAEASDFLSGRSGKWKNATFDWLIAPNNFLKVLEGNYNTKRQPVADQIEWADSPMRE